MAPKSSADATSASSPPRRSNRSSQGPLTPDRGDSSSASSLSLTPAPGQFQDGTSTPMRRSGRTGGSKDMNQNDVTNSAQHGSKTEQAAHNEAVSAALDLVRLSSTSGSLVESSGAFSTSEEYTLDEIPSWRRDISWPESMLTGPTRFARRFYHGPASEDYNPSYTDSSEGEEVKERAIDEDEEVIDIVISRSDEERESDKSDDEQRGESSDDNGKESCSKDEEEKEAKDDSEHHEDQDFQAEFVEGSPRGVHLRFTNTDLEIQSEHPPVSSDMSSSRVTRGSTPVPLLNMPGSAPSSSAQSDASLPDSTLPISSEVSPIDKYFSPNGKLLSGGNTQKLSRTGSKRERELDTFEDMQQHPSPPKDNMRSRKSSPRQGQNSKDTRENRTLTDESAASTGSVESVQFSEATTTDVFVAPSVEQSVQHHPPAAHLEPTFTSASGHSSPRKLGPDYKRKRGTHADEDDDYDADIAEEIKLQERLSSEKVLSGPGTVVQGFELLADTRSDATTEKSSLRQSPRRSGISAPTLVPAPAPASAPTTDISMKPAALILPAVVPVMRRSTRVVERAERKRQEREQREKLWQEPTSTSTAGKGKSKEAPTKKRKN